MKTKRFLFVSGVLLLAALCIGVMNLKYDRLSRYPYEDEEARALIDEYFTNKEISYIIEYSIAPSEFIDYVQYDGFSVYHAEAYNQVRNSIWYLDNQTIVYVVELALPQMSMDELIQYLLKYDGNSVIHYLEHGDPYLKGSTLIQNPDDLKVVVDNDSTLSSRILFDVIAVSSLPSVTNQPVMVSTAVVEPIKSMCIAIETELNNGATCGGLVAHSGYVSYEQQGILFQMGYNDGIHVDVPGHSEHQLGTALDFVTKEKDVKSFAQSEQYQWLKSNAHRFGFVESYPAGKEAVTSKEAQPWHWRYVGVETAQELYFNQKTLFEVNHE